MHSPAPIDQGHPLSHGQAPHWIPHARTHSQLDQTLPCGPGRKIHSHGRAVTSGRIDMLAMDGSVLWLQQDEGKGRALFLHSDGLRVYRRQPSTKGAGEPLVQLKRSEGTW